MDYVYYHFKTRDVSETWDTAQIEQYLRGTGLFPADSFTTQNPFLSLSLLCVRHAGIPPFAWILGIGRSYVYYSKRAFILQ